MAEQFPSPGFSMAGPKPVTGVGFTQLEGGLTVTSRRGDPFWRGSMETDELTLPQQQTWLSFLNKCVEQNLRVDWVHPFFAVPSAYMSIAWPLVSPPTIAAVTDLRTLSLAGLQIGMELRQGDRMSIQQAGHICYRELAENVTVTSETAQPISISPRLPLGLFSAGAEVHFKDPVIRLGIVPDSWDAEQTRRLRRLRFDVAETFR